MQRLQERRTTQPQVAAILGISLRQVERLYRAYKAAGAAGLVSKTRGRPGNRKLAESVRLEVVRLVRERYADFGPTVLNPLWTWLLHGERPSSLAMIGGAVMFASLAIRTVFSPVPKVVPQTD